MFVPYINSVASSPQQRLLSRKGQMYCISSSGGLVYTFIIQHGTIHLVDHLYLTVVFRCKFYYDYSLMRNKFVEFDLGLT